jgi:SAM-dependent methyltransferase
MVLDKVNSREYIDGTVYDEAYYEHGGHGSPYFSYNKGLLDHPGFKEYARLIAKVFKPERVLEVGCATGIILRNLRALGIEAIGIDISEYATKNAVCKDSVLQATAADLPFADNSFDLVFGCHCIEHVPPSLLEKAIAEQARVSSRWVFHVMPIWKLGPYQWTYEERTELLQSDITDLNLEDPVWWINKFTGGGQLRYRPDVRLRGTTKLWQGDYNFCQVCFEKEPLYGASRNEQAAFTTNSVKVNGATMPDRLRQTLPYRALRKVAGSVNGNGANMPDRIRQTLPYRALRKAARLAGIRPKH